MTIAEHQPAAFDEDVLGIAIVLIGYSLMTWLLARLLLSAEAREHASPLRLLLGLGITLLPLGLIIAVGFGYYYTALKLTDRLIDTLYLLMLWLVVEATFVRGLAVAARRLAYQRALSKRQSTAKDSGEGGECHRRTQPGHRAGQPAVPAPDPPGPARRVRRRPVLGLGRPDHGVLVSG